MEKSQTENLYRDTAWLYDLRNSVKAMKDISFYLARVKKTGGPVLELGCGTGRALIPLAEAGYQVWYIDLSEQILAA